MRTAALRGGLHGTCEPALHSAQLPFLDLPPRQERADRGRKRLHVGRAQHRVVAAGNLGYHHGLTRSAPAKGRVGSLSRGVPANAENVNRSLIAGRRVFKREADIVCLNRLLGSGIDTRLLFRNELRFLKPQPIEFFRSELSLRYDRLQFLTVELLYLRSRALYLRYCLKQLALQALSIES